MAAKRCFWFNMICQKLNIPGQDFECKDQLDMGVEVCKGCKAVMDNSRINVTCLPVEPLCQFAFDPLSLRNNLRDGIKFTINYLGKEIGRGCYSLPERTVDMAINCFEQITHTATVEVTCKGCTVGLANLRVAIQMSCTPEAETSANGNGTMRENVEKLVGNRDLLFTVGGSNDNDGGGGGGIGESVDPCACFGFDGGDQQMDNHLTNYRHLNMGNVKDASFMNDGCYPKVMPRLVDMAGPYEMFCNDNEDDEDLMVKVGKGPSAQFALRSALGDGNTNRVCATTSSPQLKQTNIFARRLCPLCKEDVSWLPRIGACPYCGYKPVPEFSERPYDEKTTAKELIVKTFDKAHGELADSSSECDAPRSTERSTSENLEKILRDYKCLKESIKKAENPSEDIMQQQPMTEQTNLVTVFDELKNIFCGKVRNSGTKLKGICEEACRMEKGRSSRRRITGGGDVLDSCNVSRRKKKKRIVRTMNIKMSKRYSSLSLRTTPMVRHSHAKCFNAAKVVPGHMGWLWTHCPLAQHKGWRPGSIRKSIRELMGYFLKDFPVDTLPVSKYMSYHHYNNRQNALAARQTKGEDLSQVPTLHIEKKNQEYIITLRPLKDASVLPFVANPYAKMRPVTIRIVKNPYLKQLRELKQCLKNMGFSKCTCHRPVLECHCRTFIDKKRLLAELDLKCAERNMNNVQDELVLSDTTDSEAEFDFGVTPPAGLMRPERLKPSHHVHAETQYCENDWAMDSMFPHPPNANVQYASCTVGERPGRFAFIFGKGNVHAKPKKPKMRNIKKKAKRSKGGYADPSTMNINAIVPKSILHRSKNTKNYNIDDSSEDHHSRFRGTSLNVSRMNRISRLAIPPVESLRRHRKQVRFSID